MSPYSRSLMLVLSMVAMWSFAAIAYAGDGEKPRTKAAPNAAARQDNPLLQAARQSDANPNSGRKRAYRYHDPKQGWTPAEPSSIKPWVKPAPAAAAPAGTKAKAAPKP